MPSVPITPTHAKLGDVCRNCGISLIPGEPIDYFLAEYHAQSNGGCFKATEELTNECKELMDLAEASLGIICSTNGGDWEGETTEWKDAVKKWSDEYYRLINQQFRRMPR